MKMTEDQMLDVIEKLDARRLHEEPDEENTMEYLEELDKIHQKLTTLNLATFESNEVNRLIGRAYRAGLTCNIEQADPLAGYSNLTAAIKAGEPIDYEKLEGRFAKCVHPELPTPFPIGNLQVHHDSSLSTPTGWRETIDSLGSVRRYVLMHSWWGEYDWSLWVEGDIPLRHKTADQLELGTYFLGKAHNDSSCLAYVGRPLTSDTVNTIYYAPEMLKAITPATEWEVLEEYGPFQKPEENKK